MGERVDGGTGERTGRGLQGGRRRGHAKVSTAHATRRKAKKGTRLCRECSLE